MILFERKVIKILFTIICSTVVAGMVGYWYYKYEIEDRDIGVVDYLTLEEATDVEFPVLTICLINPFVEQKLRESKFNISSNLYLDYLKGNIFNKSYELIDYNDVTLNMSDYFLFATETWLNNSDANLNSSLPIRHELIFSGFNGFGQLMKCFSLQTNVSIDTFKGLVSNTTRQILLLIGQTNLNLK